MPVGIWLRSRSVGHFKSGHVSLTEERSLDYKTDKREETRPTGVPNAHFNWREG